jgi:hypothetical protein
MVKRSKTNALLFSIDDNGEKDEWAGSGGVACLLERDPKTQEVTNVTGGLFGLLSDSELLMVLHFLIVKLQDTLDEPDFADTKIVEHLLRMDDQILVDKSSAIFSQGNTTSN